MHRTPPPDVTLAWTAVPLATLVLMAALAACGAPTPPPAGSGAALEVTFPAEGQRLSGTTAVAAAGVGGQVTSLTFELAGASVAGRTDGTAYLDTRALPDGPATLRASGVVAGRSVEDTVSVIVDNDLQASATVGPAGGSLRSSDGSIASLPPGGFAGDTMVTVDDATQASILADFGVDYPALGVTFLGALEVDTSGTAVNLPVSVDLAGWASAVQPGQAVVMFALAPDADGDGVGELMFAANAEATDTGSVVTRPVPRSQVYGFGAAGSLRVQQTASAKPGEIVTLSGRGFNPTSPLSNVARYGAASSPDAETLAHVTIEGSGFDPPSALQIAVPALGSGTQTFVLHNLTTGHRTDPITLTIESLGSGAPATWSGFVTQVEAAVTALTASRADLATLAEGWTASLAAHTGTTATAMATNSGLVSSGNAGTLTDITPGALSAAERDLVARHALVLDAVAASVPTIAQPAADLATLLATTAAGSMSTASSAQLAPQQDGGASCSGGGSTPATGISWGNPVTTGMGSAPPGSCAAGNGSGPSGSGGAGASLPANPARLDAHALATTSMRGGSFRPVQGAVVAITRPGSAERLAPFTSITDATGYFKVPFLPTGEPFTARAIDPASGRVAQVDGVSNGPDVVTPVQLLFTASDSGPGSPTASFTITPVPDPDFEGTVYYDFDAGASSDDGEIVEYVWYFDGFSASVGDDATTRRGFGRNGSYDIRLTVIDDEGKFGTAEQTLVIDDLPYDYWGSPPVHVGTFADGAPIPAETAGAAFAITPDGRYVAFSVGWDVENHDSDLVPEDSNGIRDVYRKDLDTGELLLVSEAAAGVYTGAEHVAISADGRYVAFTSRLDQDGARWRIHVRDMQTDDLETLEQVDTNLAIGPASLSADGRTLLYAIEYSGTDPSAEGAYVRDLDAGTTERLGVPAGNAWVLAITPSASHALVRANAGLYVVDLNTDAVDRADTNADGDPANAGALAIGQAISADGRYVVFTSEASNLVAEPLTQYRDHVFLKDMQSGEATVVTKNPKTSAEADANAREPVISSDGRFVFFQTYADNLVPVVQKPGPEFDGCSLDQCASGMVVVYEVASGRFALTEVGFDHTVPSGTSSSTRLVAVAASHVAFTSYNEQLVESGDGDTRRVFRAENPLWTP